MNTPPSEVPGLRWAAPAPRPRPPPARHLTPQPEATNPSN